MKLLPYFKWFPADAESDELYASLNDTELGFFHRLLNKSWTNDGLPSDLDDLAVLMKVRRGYLNRLWPRVGKCFILTETVHPRLVNPRQERERLYAVTKSERASDSVRSRYERRENEPPRALAGAECVSASCLDSKKETLPFVQPKREPIKPDLVATRFHEWISPWMRVSDEESALRNWMSRVTEDTIGAAFACRDRYLASSEVARGVMTEPWKFIVTQADNGWKGKWPSVQESRARDPTSRPKFGDGPEGTDGYKVFS